MRASESVQNFKPTLRMYANFSARTIKKVCSEIGPRETGTEAELKAQNFMAAQVGNAADDVKQEEFSLSPRAFLGWLRLAGIILIVTTAVNIINIFVADDVTYAPILSVIAGVFILFCLAGEFLFYKPVLDPFFPKAVSHNTYCIRKASGETKRRIIFAGHSDSSLEWRPTYQGGKVYLYISFIYPILGLAYNLITGIIMLATGKINDVILWISLIFIPGYVIIATFINYKLCVDGANDNLTGCMTGAAVLKYMGDNNIRFENTEVIAMFSGGEEAGLRGAKAAAKLHPEFKKGGDIETLFIGVDTVKDYDDMAVYNTDMSGITKHDKQACALLKKAAEYSELDLPYANLFFGASDAAAMTQAGVSATLLAAMNPGPPRYYHTRDDKADIMELKSIEKGIEIALEAAFLFDEQGLKDSY